MAVLLRQILGVFDYTGSKTVAARKHFEAQTWKFLSEACAEVAELVYAYVSEAYGESLESSSLSFRIDLGFRE